MMDVPAAGTSALATPSAEPPALGDRSDTLSDVLEVVRLTGALFFLVDARTPWVAEAPASVAEAPASMHNGPSYPASLRIRRERLRS